MRAGTLQLHDGKVARAAGACVRGPLVAESCVTGRSLNFPPGAALLRPSGAPSLQGHQDSSRLPRSHSSYQSSYHRATSLD